jgi:hypothetical protein
MWEFTGLESSNKEEYLRKVIPSSGHLSTVFGQLSTVKFPQREAGLAGCCFGISIRKDTRYEI